MSMMLSQSLLFSMMIGLSSTMMFHPMLVVNPHIDLIVKFVALVLLGICHRKLSALAIKHVYQEHKHAAVVTTSGNVTAILQNILISLVKNYIF